MVATQPSMKTRMRNLIRNEKWAELLVKPLYIYNLLYIFVVFGRFTI